MGLWLFPLAAFDFPLAFAPNSDLLSFVSSKGAKQVRKVPRKNQSRACLPHARR
jgi:hypothetical protein